MFTHVGVYNLHKRLFRIHSKLLALKPTDRLLGVFQSVVSYQMPWGLGCKGDGWNQDQGPKPLQSKGNAVAPLILAINEPSKNAPAQELTDDEAHICVAGKIDSKLQRQNLRCVCGCGGSELIDKSVLKPPWSGSNSQFPIQIPAEPHLPKGLVCLGRRRR